MRQTLRFPIFLGLLLASCRHEVQPLPTPPVVDTSICFERKVLPVYVSYCSRVDGGCHDAGNPRINLTTYAGIMNGIRPGNADGSWFFHVIGTGMAPWAEPQVSERQLQNIRQWINEGALHTDCITAACDTVNVRYDNDVQLIFADYCDGCHGSTQYPNPVQFSQYDWAKSYINADQQRFTNSLRHVAGAGKDMPPTYEMDRCDRVRMEAWIRRGMPK